MSLIGSYDAVVIGGGPGGSTAATLLARRGWRVALLERERFPRPHVGESLLPASMPVLEELGVLDKVESAGFPRKWGATMLWGREPEPWSWYFKETNRTYPHAYQVWRPTFDKILLDNARDAGVHVCEGCQVTGVDVVTGQVNSLDYRTDDGSKGVIESEWVVDASGQSAILGRALGLRRWDERFRNMAVYGYFEGSERLPKPDESNIFIESYSDGWVWNIPLWRGLSSVGIVVDSEQGATGIAGNGVEGFFRRQLGSTSLSRKMLSNARLTDGPQVVKDWSYTSTETVGDGWILVGDAACFVDPLFSSGVHLAMMSAVMAAAYLDVSRSDPSMRGPAARVYQDLVLQGVQPLPRAGGPILRQQQDSGVILLGESPHTWRAGRPRSAEVVHSCGCRSISAGVRAGSAVEGRIAGGVQQLSSTAGDRETRKGQGL